MALSFRVRATFGLLKALTTLGLAPSTEKTLAMPVEKRMAFGPSRRMTGPRLEVPYRDVQVPTRDCAQIRVRVYEPRGATAPVLYLHGGGFFVGGINACDHICRRLAVESSAVVVSVEYRLAPDHKFPIPLDDCEDALAWLLTQPWDASRLVVAGDSAGGNLAASLALRLRAQAKPLAGQLLVYPVLDVTGSGNGALSYRGVGTRGTEIAKMVEVYAGDHDPTDPYVSPLFAPDLGGLPPTLMITVEHDALHDEGVLYAERLRAAGVPTSLIDVPDHVHASLSLPTLYNGIDALYDRMSAFLRDPLAAAESG